MTYKNEITKEDIERCVISFGWNINKCTIQDETIYIEVQLSRLDEAGNIAKFIKYFEKTVTDNYHSCETFISDNLEFTIKIS